MTMNCSRSTPGVKQFLRSVIRSHHPSYFTDSSKLQQQITRLITTSHELGCIPGAGGDVKKSVDGQKVGNPKKDSQVSKSSLTSDAKKKTFASSSSSSSSSSSDSDDESSSKKGQNRIHQKLPSSIRTTRHVDEILSILEEPPKVRFGWLKISLTILSGIYFGAVCARIGASLLEEYEIFVKDDDDDDWWSQLYSNTSSSAYFSFDPWFDLVWDITGIWLCCWYLCDTSAKGTVIWYIAWLYTHVEYCKLMSIKIAI